MAKPRVHEIAKELGVPSKDLIAKLIEMGEYVKGPSSTLEAPVIRKVRDAFPAPAKAPAKEEPAKPAAKKAPARAAEPAPEAAPEPAEAPAATAKPAGASEKPANPGAAHSPFGHPDAAETAPGGVRRRGQARRSRRRGR